MHILQHITLDCSKLLLHYVMLIDIRVAIYTLCWDAWKPYIRLDGCSIYKDKILYAPQYQKIDTNNQIVYASYVWFIANGGFIQASKIA